jgi:hypothetical protein
MSTATQSVATAAAVFAVSVAAVAVPAQAAPASGGKTVACYGINTCKGTSDCKSGNHGCKGHEQLQGPGLQVGERERMHRPGRQHDAAGEVTGRPGCPCRVAGWAP